MKNIIRKLLQSPGFTFVSVLTLAVGIGANTAIFSVVYAVMLQPLPYPEADRLYGLWHSAPGLNLPQFEQSNPTYLTYRQLNQSFTDIGIVNEFTVNLISGGEPIRVPSSGATASLLYVLGVRPELGRLFTEAECEFQGPHVAILSYELWRGRFGGSAEVIGQKIDINGSLHEVVGVMPADFAFPNERIQIWLPHQIDPATLTGTSFSYAAIGRLKPGISEAAAEEDLNRALARLPEVYPGELTKELMQKAQLSAHINPLIEDVVGDVGQVMWILFGTMSFVLLIACANVANLFLVRADGRNREIALRTALGATGGNLFRYFLSESLIMAGMGGAVGIGLAYFGLRVLLAMSPQSIPRLHEVTLDSTALGFAAGISLLVGITFGLLPLIRHRRRNIISAIQESGVRTSAGRSTNRTRNVFVVAQVTLALILLVGAALMARSFWELRGVDPGFQTDGILTLRLSLPEEEYATASETADFYEQLLARLRSLPGVVEAGGISNLPLTDGESNSGFFLEDFPLQDNELPPIIRTLQVTPGYFRAMGIPVREGRTLERGDFEGDVGAVVLSAKLADRFYKDRSSLGRRVHRGMRDPDYYSIVGVVGDVRDKNIEESPVEMVYFPLIGIKEGDAGWVTRTMTIAIRTTEPPMAFAPVARQTVWDLNPRLPVANIRSIADVVERSMARSTYTAILLGIAAAMALLLGTIGIYGVISYIVSQRTREIGVRMALGAQRADVSRMVLRQGVLVSFIGIFLGVLGTVGLTRFMRSLLYGVSSTDPLTIAAVALLLLSVAVMASYIPARRAATVDPVEALRYE